MAFNSAFKGLSTVIVNDILLNVCYSLKLPHNYLVLCDEERISWHYENRIVSWPPFPIHPLSLTFGVAKLSSVKW